MYERELRPLLAFIKKHPGLSVAEVKKEIQNIPWPSGTTDNWKPPYDGTRMAKDCPAATELKWKLRYMELTGDVECKGGKWFTLHS